MSLLRKDGQQFSHKLSIHGTPTTETLSLDLDT
jgi:hypothetical protein